jgi:hypothetical protein
MNPCVLMLPLHFGLKDAVLACPLSQRFERPSKPFCEPHETSHQAGVFLVFVLGVRFVVLPVLFGNFLSADALCANSVD